MTDPIVPVRSRLARAPSLLSGEVIELEDSFDDASLEMNATGDKFRVAAALQAQLIAAAEDAADALVAAAAAQSAADAALAAAAAAQTTADAALAAAGATGNPFIDPPTVADSFDDEFRTGSPDLALRGWTIKSLAGTTLTRAGDIAPWDTTGPAAGTYWSTLIGSWLFIQTPPSTQFYVAKAITLAVGDTYSVRVGTPFRHDSGAVGRFQEVAFWGNNAGTPDPNNRIYLSVYETNGAPTQLDMGRTLAGVFGGTSRNKWYRTDIKGIYYQASPNTFRVFGVDSDSGDSITNSPSGGPNASALAWFGVSNVPGAASGAATPAVMAIDFARRQINHHWIARP